MNSRIRFETAHQVFAEIPEILEDMCARPDGSVHSVQFARERLESAIPEEALTFCAYMLEKRAAIWWGHECLVHLQAYLVDDDLPMLSITRQWAENPDEANQYRALNAANEKDDKTPAVWLALAVGWSGNSMAPEGAPPVPPPEFLCPRAINAAVLSALALVENVKRKEALGGLVHMALHIAEEK